MVWGYVRDMGDLSLVFSSPFARRIYICTSNRQRISPFDTGESTPRISSDHFAVARSRLVFLELASPPRPVLETGARGRTDPRNPGIISYQRGPALSSSFQHGAIIAKLVRPS